MLISEQEERGRKFKLALRAGLPVLILIGLVAYGTFFQGERIHFGLRESLLAAALVFVTTYFIYFLLEEDSQKTLIDQTTRSYNFPAFLRYYSQKKPQSLALILLNNLATINENFGHEQIDRMLRSLVFQLDATLRAHHLPRTIIGRRHGAEFLIGADAPEAALKEAIRAFVEEHASIQGVELDYRFTVIAKPQGEIAKAIAHLHDQVTVPDDAYVAESPAETPTTPTRDNNADDLERGIMEAIDAQRVVFTLRPLLDTRTQKVDTYEIAVKLKLSNGTELLPRVYLPIVNRLGFGRDYDRAILRHAIELLSLSDPSIAFSFNLSPFSLRDKDFQTQAFKMIASADIEPSRLIIELYERKTHHNLEGYLKTLGTFRAQGVRICIDNFGSSNASMEYMRHFKFDMVQFDREYVARLDDQNSHAMLQSLVDMSQNLGITTVAKWVDKEEQKQKLIAMGVDYLQGFGIAKPLSEEQLIAHYN